MEKKKDRFMDLNHETAMRLWNKHYGKSTKATDFAGRKIVKGAYNDRNSEFGWNVDHILPQSRGGVTADHNLVIVNIKTNDEKADKFPGFAANGKKFTIVKVENHYEIKPMKKDNHNDEEKETEVTNLYDSASGIRLYKKFKGLQTKTRFVGTVEILLNGIRGANTAITDFIEEIFLTEDVQFAKPIGSLFNNTGSVRILVKNYEMFTSNVTNDLLDKCVLLNTYLGYYFLNIDAVGSYSISYRLDSYDDRISMFDHDYNLRFTNNGSISYNNILMINPLVIRNSYAKDKFDDYICNSSLDSFYEYNYIFTNLAKNLEKEASKK